MKSIEEIFNKTIFRIPDYQRGFSWVVEEHVDDFWCDLENLTDGRIHYTGNLTFENAHNKLSKWDDVTWLIKDRKYSTKYIIDGQQRITSIIILINVLLDLLEDDKKYQNKSKKELTEKYLFVSNNNGNLIAFIFGYEIDDPSYEYLKTKIFQQHSSRSGGQPETSYTNNLEAANKYFRKKLVNASWKDRDTLFNKVTRQLKFDVKDVDKELDVFVVFETLNNRGKELTNLEKLKNRLIYLSTLIPGSNLEEKKDLRNNINNIWKNCYEYLGKNKKNPLDDDDFLRTHFIVYHGFSKEKGFPFRDIFKDIYIVSKVTAKNKFVNFKGISKYIQSIQDASKQWYIIQNPLQAFEYGLIEGEESKWLDKLDRLQIGAFYPMLLAARMIEKDEDNRINLYKAIESFSFLNFYCAGRRSTIGNTEYPKLAYSLYYRQISVKEIINQLEERTFGNEDEEGEFTPEKFINNISDYFTSRNNGFYDWRPGINYLLYEFEEFLRRKEDMKVPWEKGELSIEHIYPQDDSDAYWQKQFRNYSKKEKRILCGSLGNLLLIKQAKNSELSNESFPQKKEHKYKSGSTGGYKWGTHSEIDVCKEKNWNPKSILRRGIVILDFLNKRWKLHKWEVALTRKDKKHLLLIDENLIKKL